MELISEDSGASFFEDSERMLVVAVTDEGVIIDAYTQGDALHLGNAGRPVGTIAMTAEEWWEWLKKRDS